MVSDLYSFVIHGMVIEVNVLWISINIPGVHLHPMHSYNLSSFSLISHLLPLEVPGHIGRWTDQGRCLFFVE